MADPIRHILFSDSAAHSLGEALRQVGCKDRVICLPDDLSFGPINPPDPVAREEWMHRELKFELTDEERPIDQVESFWNEALAARGRRIVWVSKRAAQEFAGFLEFVWRAGQGNCDLVAFAGDAVVSPRGSGGRAIVLSELPSYHLASTRYWDRAVSLERAERKRYRASWARLRDENAPLRILTEDGLVSAPITYFDDLLIACTIERWRKSARVIGETLVSFMDGPFHQVGDFVLAARLRALIEAGRLEGKGDLGKMRFSEVRLPGSQDAPPPIGSDASRSL